MTAKGELPDFEIKKLNMLSFPTDVIPKCELTGVNANFQLTCPDVTLYYASEQLAGSTLSFCRTHSFPYCSNIHSIATHSSHSLYWQTPLIEQAWYGIIGKIAHLLGPLLAPAPMIGSKDDRTRRSNNILYSKRHLIDFCLAESSTFLSVKKFQLAGKWTELKWNEVRWNSYWKIILTYLSFYCWITVPAASQALKFCRELDGDTSILLVEPYLQLAQASFGLRRYKQCQEYLALARWIVLNAEECTDLTRSRLHQLCGRLYATQGEYIYIYIYIYVYI